MVQVFLSDVHVLNLETMTWSNLRGSGRVPPPLANMTLTSVGGKCYVFGGTDATGTCFNDIRVLELDSFQVTEGQDAALHQTRH